MLDVDLNLHNMNTFLKQTLWYDSKPLTNITTVIDNIDFFLFFFFFNLQKCWHGSDKHKICNKEEKVALFFCCIKDNSFCTFNAPRETKDASTALSCRENKCAQSFTSLAFYVFTACVLFSCDITHTRILKDIQREQEVRWPTCGSFWASSQMYLI